MPDELLTPGKGKFIVKRVKTHDDYNVPLMTKKGDRKVLLVIDVTDARGQKGVVFEHLTMKLGWKVEAICKACDLPELYIADDLCLDNLDGLEGAVGECLVGHSEPDPNWPVKNIISRYVYKKDKGKLGVQKTKLPSNDAVVDEFFDDEIPF